EGEGRDRAGVPGEFGQRLGRRRRGGRRRLGRKNVHVGAGARPAAGRGGAGAYWILAHAPPRGRFPVAECRTRPLTRGRLRRAWAFGPATAVVARVTADVVPHRRDVRLADRERGLPGLPVECGR